MRIVVAEAALRLCHLLRLRVVAHLLRLHVHAAKVLLLHTHEGLRHRRLLYFERVEEGGALAQCIQYDVHFVLPDALFFDDVLNNERIATHGHSFLNQGLLLLLTEGVDDLIRIHAALQRQLTLESLPLLLLRRARHDATCHEKVNYLTRQLSEHFLGELEVVVLALFVWYKLNDVSSHELFEFLRIQRLVVSIKDVHVVEVSVAHADYDDGQGLAGASHNLIDCLLHVRDDAISDDQQQVVLLIVLRHFDCLTPIIDV